MKQTEIEKWTGHYEEWKKSNQTQRDYCLGRNISFNTFKNKTWKVRRKDAVSKFEPIQVIRNPKEEDEPYCRLVFKDAGSISITSRESLKALKGLVQCMLEI